MEVTTVSTTDGSLLAAVRETISLGDDVLLAVAFVASPGVHLIRKELLGARRARLLATTAFDRGAAHAALTRAATDGVEVRLLNPRGGTYHPKVYLGRAGDRVAAVIGSANLTQGLVVNTEAAIHLRGAPPDPPLRDSRDWAEAQWEQGEPYVVPYESAIDEIEPALLAAVRAAFAVDPVFRTLRHGRPNRVAEVTPTALCVETERARARGRVEPVPAWMMNLAWEVLHRRGALTNRELLDELRVHRSSAVLAILGRLAGIEPLPGRAVGVRLVRR